MTSEEQVQRWVVGESIHNDERGECCPDFSCCKPELLAAQEEREAFARADRESRISMLGTFLGRAMEAAFSDKRARVYVAGDPANYGMEQ